MKPHGESLLPQLQQLAEQALADAGTAELFEQKFGILPSAFAQLPEQGQKDLLQRLQERADVEVAQHPWTLHAKAKRPDGGIYDVYSRRDDAVASGKIFNVVREGESLSPTAGGYVNLRALLAVKGADLVEQPDMAVTGRVKAEHFHPMKGHVRQGMEVLFKTGEVLQVQSTMTGWSLRNNQSGETLGPYDGAQALTIAIVERDAQAPSVDDTPVSEREVEKHSDQVVQAELLGNFKPSNSQYVEEVLRLHKAGEINAFEVYSSVYRERTEDESIEGYIRSCAEQDYEDLPYGGCLFQELIVDKWPHVAQGNVSKEEVESALKQENAKASHGDDLVADPQRKALASLKAALQEATDTGLLDELAGSLHPDIINQFCDEVNAFDLSHVEPKPVAEEAPSLGM